ncbi:metallophosphoesterase [Oleiharenicola lentus]|uniref:metallophosphoesterase n=1 Tax=Oleiharenicola lentus TaxID=2508720 RepID=UPI003F680FE7
MKKLLRNLFLAFVGTLLLGVAAPDDEAPEPVSSFQKPVLEQAGSWSLIMVPDTQNYVKWIRNQPILDLMTAWIEENIDPLNIKMVVIVGDLVQNDEKIINDYDGNQTTMQQWQSVSRALARLDGKVPYVAATGNHDYSINAQGVRTSHFSDYITTERNHLNQKALVQNNRNEQWQPTLENSAYELKNLNGRDYLFLTVEFAPRDTIVEWAKKIAALEQYKNHRVVFITHAYLNDKDQHIKGEQMNWLYWEPYNINNVIQKSSKIALPTANTGKQLWEKLVQPSANIELTLSGHVSGEGYRVDTNIAGKAVHQVLFDAQTMGGGHRSGNGGDGWLRILEFFPDNKTVKVRTFSPLFGASPTTQPFAWKKDARNEFTMEFK